MPAPRTVHRGGHRYYVHPDRGREHPGVTSILGMLPKQMFLVPWATKMTAELAADTLATPEGRAFFADMVERDRRGAIDYLKGASRRYTRARASVGSEAHDLFERMLRAWPSRFSPEEFADRFRRVHPDVEEHRSHFAQFLAAVNPEMVRAEEVVWSDTHGYAGSYDAIVNVWLMPNGTPDPSRKHGTRRTVVVDWKTGKSVHSEVGLQLAAYASADVTIDSDGAEHPIPELEGALVLHITDTDWAFHPVRGSLHNHFETFLLLRRLFQWDREVAPTMIGKPIAGSGRLVTGTERRA